MASEAKLLSVCYGKMAAVIEAMLASDPSKRTSAAQARDSFKSLRAAVPESGAILFHFVLIVFMQIAAFADSLHCLRASHEM